MHATAEGGGTMHSRRDFNSAAALAFGGLALTSCSKLKYLPDGIARAPGFRRAQNRRANPFGPLRPDPNTPRLLDLPEGFSYEVISSFDDPLAWAGGFVPDAADGMGSFAFGEGRMVLVRNHELDAKDFAVG